MVARRPRRDDWGDLVFMHIPTAPDVPISGKDLAKRSKLTINQVQDGVAALRDRFPDFPLVSNHLGYRFSEYEVDVTPFRRKRMRSALTIIRRLWTGVLRPFLLRQADPQLATFMTKQFERAMQDIADLVG